MLANILFRRLKQLRHLSLRQPNSLILKPRLDQRRLTNDQLAFIKTGFPFEST